MTSKEKQVQSFEQLIDKLDERVDKLIIEVQSIIKIASDYEGFDFSEEIRDWIKDVI
ncbi:MAG: hypothetical protein JHC33_01250 [Ignisphaera sp.]|nr:hypothetical protein [Ignisphaera sp.]